MGRRGDGAPPKAAPQPPRRKRQRTQVATASSAAAEPAAAAQQAAAAPPAAATPVLEAPRQAQEPAGAAADDGSSDDGSFKRFARAWQWKREHLPDRDRFRRPYKHELLGAAGGGARTLTIKQSSFNAEGFASTVWDSSIVVAKYLERHAQRYAGRRCLDLSAGCGLVGIAAALLGARVTCTDLAPNLQLLRDNCEANAPGLIDVREHRWGEDLADLQPPFDAIFAQDVMYVAEAIPDLLRSLRALSGPATELLVAHGRNRWALDAFLQGCAGAFEVRAVPGEELHEAFRSPCVDVLRLRLLAAD